MASFPYQTSPPARPRNWFAVALTVGLSLVVLASGFLVFQLLSGGAADSATDFAEATCEDFDVAETAEFSELAVESSNARAGDEVGLEGGNLYCRFASGAGQTVTVTVVAMSDEDGPAEHVQQARQIAEVSSDLGREDFGYGDHSGIITVRLAEAVQSFHLYAAGGRLSVMVRLESRPPELGLPEAVGFVESVAVRAFERFEAYV